MNGDSPENAPLPLRTVQRIDSAAIRARIPDELVLLARLMAQSGFRLYVVGGLVRNALIGLSISDIDICSAMLPDDFIALSKANGFTVFLKGVAFGTVEVHIGGQKFEHTTFRSDSYSAGGAHRPSAVRFSSSPDQDAFRRDFSVNALYYDILSDELIDPTGGLSDLAAGLVRTTSREPELVLRDDGLRILRLVRFASELGFSVDAATFDTAKRLVLNLRDISAERVRDEINKLLLADVKYGGRSAERVLYGLELFQSLGGIDVVFPELALGSGMAQKPQYHRYDVLGHCLHAAAEAAPTLVLRLAGLLHDVGKPPVKRETGKMYGHEIAGADIAREILRRLRYDNKTIDEVVFLVRNHMYDLNNSAKDSTLRRTFARWGYERSLLVTEIRIADVHGSGVITDRVATAERWKTILAAMKAEGAPFSERELCCTGDELMRWLNLSPGPELKELKRRLLSHCAVHPRDNTPERLKKVTQGMLPLSVR